MSNNFTTFNLTASEQIRLIECGGIDATNITQAQLEDLAATLEDIRDQGKDIVDSMNGMSKVFDELDELEAELDKHFDEDTPLNYKELQEHFTITKEAFSDYESFSWEGEDWFN